ncbi:MAG: hypothetical protein JWM93_2996, partial [Frankiales bacterium]|nr:hypothetical protein [Frankiales bacterium]
GETWIAADGRRWRHDNYSGFDEYFAFSPSEVASFGNPTPAFLSTLPTDPAALNAYLRKHVTGSSSTDAAVFTAVGDLLRTGITPPVLRAAALRVLARMDVVTTSSAHDSLGRTAVKVSYVDPGQGGALLVDPATADLLEEQNGPAFTVTYISDTAPTVPDLVTAATGLPAGPTAG